MSDKPTIITPIGKENKAYTFNPNTGKSRVYDFDHPDPDMLRQMADVLLNRIDSTLTKRVVLKMLYVDNAQSVIPAEVKAIVSDLVADTITPDEARQRVLAWKETING
jgi:hypothetical protein